VSGEPVQNHADPAVPTAAPADAPRRAVVLFMILATAVLFVGLFVILYVRWAGSEEPSSVVVVSATSAFAGSQIVIEGFALRAPYQVTVGSGDREIFPFYLEPGSYTLRVVRDDASVFSDDFPLQKNQMLQFDLSKIEHLLPSPATGGATATPSAPARTR
jgi:hypothetical protein